ncbi:unnamed protein product [Owenia fusiformis]|uniref:Uncharacterized protein n=1 Tax=Owenia fusiformis TaxID=6347 RepID=A0A8J1UK67_OWEFU|nr:unnamed protein product [Owenia fusiformis]
MLEMKRNVLCLALCLALLCICTNGLGIYKLGDELIVNGNMEYDNWDSNYQWYPRLSTLTQIPGVVGQAAAITPSIDENGWIGQNLYGDRALTFGGHYYMEGYLKVLNHPGGLDWFNIDLRFRYIDKDSIYRSLTIGEYFRIRDSDGWVKISGEFTVPDNCTEQRVFITGVASPNLQFAVDEFSLKQIIPDEDWEAAANEMIDEYRKGQVNVNVNITYNLDPSYVTFGIRQLSHDFKLGAHITSQVFNGTWVTAEVSEAYRNYFHDNFNSATPNFRFRWNQVEKLEGVLDYTHVDKAISSLNERGVNVIGSNIFRDHENHMFPLWASDKTETEKIDLMKKRVNDVAAHFSGKVDTYIVCRDNLRRGYYQQATGDYDIIDKMFVWMEATGDPATLVISDTNVIRSSERTSALAQQAKTLKDSGHNLQIGVQGMFEAAYTVDPIRLMARFDILAQAELPILVTRLNIQRVDVMERARDLEHFLRVAFAHPNVDGITLEGFWDQKMPRADSSLVDTDDFVINKAGWTLSRLFKKEWRTDGILTLPEKFLSQQTASFRAFYGEYEIDVMVDGEVVDTRTFSVHKGVPTEIDVDINSPNTV